MSVSSSDRLEVLETTSTEGTYKMRIDKIASGGGGGGTTDYEDLDNKPSVNSNELIGNKTSSQLGLQDTLVSGTNIKTVNNQSILGSGNIDIEGGGSSQKVWTAVCNTSADTQVKVVTTTTGGFTLQEGNILIVLFYTGQTHISPSLQVDSNSARSIYNGYANCWGSYEPVVFAVDEDGDFEMLGIQATTGLFGKTKLSTAVNSTATNLAATPSAVKQAYDLAGQKQDELVSGTNIKTVNNQTLLGSGNINIARSASDIWYDQESTVEEILDSKPYTWQVQNMVNAKQDTLVSGTNIKTVNNQSLLGSGNIDVSGGGGISFDDVYPIGSIYMSVNNVNPSTLFGGTWTQIENRFLLAAGSTYTAGDTGGSASQSYTPAGTNTGTAITVNQMPSHQHEVVKWTKGTKNTAAKTGFFSTNASGGSGWQMLTGYDSSRTHDCGTTATGGGQTHTHTFNGTQATIDTMPPYLVVYMWQRTA